MKKIAFLFGAGAEGAKNFDIRMGYEYLAASLYPEARKEYIEDLKNCFGNEYFDNKFSLCSDTVDAGRFMLNNFIMQKSLHDEKYFNKYRNDIRKILYDEQLKQISDNSEKHISGCKDYIKDVKGELEEILRKEKEQLSQIHNDVLRDLFEEKDEKLVFDVNVGLGGVLDSYFHTIIDPDKFGKKRFSKIFNFYWACYFTILEDVLKFLSKKEITEFDKYLENGKINYSEVLNNIDDLTKQLYKIDINKVLPPGSYYALINNKLNDFEENTLTCCGIITTNYFRFCEAVSDKVAYLNGQLRYFEYPEVLEVGDLSVEENNSNHLMFPFIFSQSLVKPIVNSKQIEAFDELNNILKEADILVILGFNINEDDNHINAFLHDFVKNKPIIIVTDDKECDFSSKLKYCGENIHICYVDYEQGNDITIDKIFGTVKDI